ncbi:MAG: bifunctional diguanylate cyclase/phosphodiesterase [Sphingomonadales bacterium]|nr:bifunctional diguanylate cyclase/phosphodiesterase [Sphingomonadales bacterium]MBD3774361.1 bifunctional diguanylate cyclase/phosphodiesterase [Paracoccaceae bacterium]
MLAYAPLLVLSAVFGAVTGLLLANKHIPTGSVTYLIIAGAIIYIAAFMVIARVSVLHIARLESVGLTDSLSLLPNRRALHADIQQISGGNSEFAVALMDLDGFKIVNDNFGHAVGDKLIKQCAAIVVEQCGTDARCYRLGGDEFAVSVVGQLAGTILEGVCRNLLQRLKTPIVIDDRRITIGASIGLSRSDGKDGLTSSELLRRSDVAMYAAKGSGKMRCTWYKDEFDRNREALRELDGELRRALTDEEFVLNYQPLVDSRSGKVVAVECLIRWQRPDGKPVGPHIFIPVAEESGLINALGLWILRRACQDALGWDGIKLSVNISSAQLRDPEFPVQLAHIIEETGFPAERLELEITETCLVLDPVIAERSLHMIRGFGVNVALDDFGTGYASIGFLRQFRFEKLKLDRSLVVDAEGDDSSRAMMVSSISMARALKMDVTAEGVETEAQADMVRAAGCDQIQGWLYYKAMPAGEIGELLTDAEADEDFNANTGLAATPDKGSCAA